jgi:hypothetical protein
MNRHTRKILDLSIMLVLLVIPLAQSVSAQHSQLLEQVQKQAKLVPRIKIWVKTFIPFPKVEMTRFGPCFSGDNRSYSDAPDASCRTHQEIEFEVTPIKVLNNNSYTGMSHLIHCHTGRVIISAQANANRIISGPVAPTNHGTINVQMTLAASNPLVYFAPDVDMEISLDFDWAASQVTVRGRHDGYPAFEIYISVNGGQPSQLYHFSPQLGDERKLLPPMDVEIKPDRRSFAVSAVGRKTEQRHKSL